MRISNDVANVLASSTIEGDKLFLPNQLDRKLYVAVNKVLTSIGGKWARGVGAHVFSAEPANIVEEIVQSGEYIDSKKDYDFFETPEWLAEALVAHADIQTGDRVLEPSAGRARIAQVIRDLIRVDATLHCGELNPADREWLANEGYDLVSQNFLDVETKYDIIIQNPPFSKQQDIRHINHALDLAPKVVSVASASVLWRDNKLTVAFRERVADLGGYIEELPEDTFKESGTRVRTVKVVVGCDG